MKNLVLKSTLSVCLMFLCISLLAQISEIKKHGPCMEESAPEPPNGINNLLRWIEENKKPIEIPQSSKPFVHVMFTIDESGSVSKAAVANSITTEADKEALRLIKNMPKWKWSTTGKKVKCYSVFPIRFKRAES